MDKCIKGKGLVQEQNLVELNDHPYYRKRKQHEDEQSMLRPTVSKAALKSNTTGTQ